jgi:hypothetical protein
MGSLQLVKGFHHLANGINLEIFSSSSEICIELCCPCDRCTLPLWTILMNSFRGIIIAIFGFFPSLICFSQRDTLLLHSLTIPLNRQLAHDNIDKEQRNILTSSGRTSPGMNISADAEVNFMATQALTTGVDWIQYDIEKDSTLNHNKRLYYLRGLQNILRNLQSGWKSREFEPAYLPQIVTALTTYINLDKAGQSIFDYTRSLSYQVATPIIRSSSFETNTGIAASRNELLLKYCAQHPERTFITLRNNPNLPFADSLIRVMARKYPVQLYSYAQSGSQLANIIRNINDDDFIKVISRMARSKSGQQYFPFLDNIVNGKMTFEEIDAADKDSVQYYRLLVKTQIEYVRRLPNHDTAFAFRELTAKLEKKAKDIFVNTINALHESSDAVRFRCLQNLTGPELYYLAVLSDGLIYTSSYTK